VSGRISNPLDNPSVDAIDEKLLEADFFCDRVVDSGLGEIRFYVSAFCSASRSVEDALHKNMIDYEIPSYGAWAASTRAELLSDPVRRFLTEYRHANQHRGTHGIGELAGNDLQSISESLRTQMNRSERFGPYFTRGVGIESLPTRHVPTVCCLRMRALVQLVMNLYEEFGHYINPAQRYDPANRDKTGLDGRGALREWGYPAAWLDTAPHRDHQVLQYFQERGGDYRPWPLVEKYGRLPRVDP
jgi:hypothetical protein